MVVGSPPSPAGSSRPAAAAGIPLVAGARLPLAFIGFGIGAVAIAAMLQAAQPAVVLLAHSHPHVVALAHLWLPGFLLSVSMGAVYQLMPVVLGVALRLSPLATWTHYGFHVAGVVLLVGGFALGRFEIVAVGGTAVTIGSCVLFVGTWRTFLSSARRDAVAWSFPLAVSWLAATTFLGVMLAVNRRVTFLPMPVMDLLRAHAHLGWGGFFLTLLQGATFQLVPMFTMSDLRRPGCVRTGLILSQAGLVGATTGLAWGLRPLAIAGALVLASAVASSGVGLIATLRARRRRTLEPGMKAFALGGAMLALATAAGVALMISPVGSRAVQGGVLAYGILTVAGAFSLMISGMLCKIVPFLVWMKTYGPRAGRQAVPVATALGSRFLENAWLFLHGTGLALLIAGVLGQSLSTVTIGSSVLAAGILMFLSNLARILCHAFRPQTSATPGPRGRAIPSLR